MLRVPLVLRFAAPPPSIDAAESVLALHGALVRSLEGRELRLSVTTATDVGALATGIGTALGVPAPAIGWPVGDPRGAAGAGYACQECGGVDDDHFPGCSRA
ncbi:hypothetical protein [Herbidospora daliensis]|uniref:hypothetical protein n=1 Tax=Herbidospora daliensis TaxID=295585 RepID=UPI00078637B0|nr:hypothetical protein [Herbidospora daliensis]